MSSKMSSYHRALPSQTGMICEILFQLIQVNLVQAEGKIWHGHPVWFLKGNPIVGYAVQKKGVQLLFWSGQSFEQKGLSPIGKFKAAQMIFQDPSEINRELLKQLLDESLLIQWDYQNIVRNHGNLQPLCGIVAPKEETRETL